MNPVVMKTTPTAADSGTVENQVKFQIKIACAHRQKIYFLNNLNTWQVVSLNTPDVHWTTEAKMAAQQFIFCTLLEICNFSGIKIDHQMVKGLIYLFLRYLVGSLTL